MITTAAPLFGGETGGWNEFHSHCFHELVKKSLPEEIARKQIDIIKNLNMNSAEDLRQKSISFLEDKGVYMWTLQTLSQFYFSPENFGNLVIDISRENKKILKSQSWKYMWFCAGFALGFVSLPVLCVTIGK